MTRPLLRGNRLGAALLIFSALAILPGVFRVGELLSDPPQTLDNARYLAAPLATYSHIIGGTLLLLLGTLQLMPALRRWHRRIGYIAVSAGLIGLIGSHVLALRFPVSPASGHLLASLRLVVGSALILLLVAGVRAARRRDLAAHRRHMSRALAIAYGGATAALVGIPMFLLGATMSPALNTALVALGWVVNLAMVENHLSRGRPAPLPRAKAPAALA